ncbi:glycosyltransferase family 4 protein [Methanosphaera sp. WGK6]|uniref:glycosyltransferase family 4 protein n=1 Tax=Methanosphaera sp. WGK6 TaxID=1561964 RepID=UPI00084C805A|nr:glycosyltransferase family 4 protein [Methanosphaera sp. WGK6]
MPKKTKILFTHNTAMWYRIPFFKKLAEIYDLNLVFTHIDVIQDIYDNKIDKKIKGLEEVNYTTLNNKHGFAKGLIKKACTNNDFVIGGSWDTIQELIESIILFSITKIKQEKFIIWREDWDWEKENNLKEKILNCIIKYLTNHADAIIVPGTLHKQYFHNKLGVSEDKIHIMPNVSNISGIDENIKKSTNNKKILYVGRLIPRKGIKYLLEAYSNLKKEVDNIQLLIIGSGPEENSLKEYVKENNIKNVEFLGQIKNNELKEYYQRSNLVVIPSINKGMGDPWVFVLNEAMYYGNPVIATTAVGAAPDMIKNNGFIVPEKDSDTLFKAMRKIITDNDLEEKMSQESKNIIKKEFQYTNMINAFIKTINSIK